MHDWESLWDFDDPAGSERRFRDARADLPGSANDERRAVLDTQIARTYSLRRRFDDAHRLLDAVEAELGDALGEARVRVSLERGRAHNSAGEREAARARFAEAWEWARTIEHDALAVDAAHMIAIAESGPAVLEWNQRALALAEASAAPGARRWRASLLNNIGWTHHAAGAYEAALPSFERALAVQRETGDARAIRVARWCVARTFRSLGRLDEALAEQQALAAELEAVGETDGYVLEELAESLHALGRVDDARPYFAAAHARLSDDPWLPADEPERLARLARLAHAD